jgi:hypothetical protein
MSLVERLREKLERSEVSHRAAAVLSGETSDRALDKEGPKLGYEPNWTRLLRGIRADGEEITGLDVDDELDGHASTLVREASWTKLLGRIPTDADAINKADIAATKLAAQELCHLMSPDLCQCPGDPLKCHAVKAYMQPALKVVRALRKSELLR